MQTMMESFLRKVATRLSTDYPTDADCVLVVFNNRRSLRFFQQQFISLGRTMMLPRTMAIDDLVAKLGGMRVIPNEFLLFELYRIHCELEGEKRKYREFDDFISFGDLMLGDFAEVDQYMVDARQLFGNLHDLKAIGEWDIEGSDLTPFQRNYLHFYQRLYDYYDRLHRTLEARGEAYSGMAYRYVAEHIVDLAAHVEAEQVYFVGFNAISECERRIIGHFVRSGRGHLITDGDPYFMQPEQEAGHFIRKHGAQFPEMLPQGKSLFAEGERRVTIVECPEALLQCKMAGQLIEEHPDWLSTNDPERTAVVLADESLLLPALNSLPEGNYGINVSMGFSFCDSQMYLLAQRLLQLHNNATATGYHHADVVALLSDRYMQLLLSDDRLATTLAAEVREADLLRLAAADLRTRLCPPLPNGFNPQSLFPDRPFSADEWVAEMRSVVSAIVEAQLLADNRQERQAAGALVEMLDYIALLQQQYHYINSLDTLRKIFSRIAQRHQVDLLGDPLSGLQLMGMLETRNLDFDRVLLLSVNEGIIPATRNASSLVPYELKRQFGMPTYHEKDSVYAFNFYHLMLRAREVYLFYSTGTEGLQKGEPSRFISQVEHELAPRFGIEVQRMVVSNNSALTSVGPVYPDGLPKSAAIMKLLYTSAEHGLTPTSFDDYLQCPLRYYYCRVLGLGSDSNPEEAIDTSHLGSAIHGVIEELYRPYLGVPITDSIMREMWKRRAGVIDRHFMRLLHSGRSAEGANLYMRRVAEAQVDDFLRMEEKQIREGHRLEVIALEQRMQPVVITHTEDGQPVRLRGTVDRIDRFDGTLRIIDYKTGSFKDEELDYKTVDKNGEEKVPSSKWFQLMCYALLYSRQPSDGRMADMQVGIYPLRMLGKGVSIAFYDGRSTLCKEQVDTFCSLLASYSLELLNPAVPFQSATKSEACRYCPARTFCDGVVV